MRARTRMSGLAVLLTLSAGCGASGDADVSGTAEAATHDSAGIKIQELPRRAFPSRHLAADLPEVVGTEK